jgi:hypothetical protein
MAPAVIDKTTKTKSPNIFRKSGADSVEKTKSNNETPPRKHQGFFQPYAI